MRLAILLCRFPSSHAASVIPQGSHVLLRLVNSVSTRTAREGDHVYMRTATPIVVNGEIVVPVDSYVQGVVAHARRSGRVTGRAELAIRIENLTLPSGKAIQLSPQLSSVDSDGTDQKVETKEGAIQQGGSKGVDAERVAILTGGGAAPRRHGRPGLEGRRHWRRRRRSRGSGLRPPHPRPRSGPAPRLDARRGLRTRRDGAVRRTAQPH